MFLLDTDVLSSVLDERRAVDAVRARLLSEAPEAVFISVVSLEEMLRGALARVNAERRTPGLPAAYEHLLKLHRALQPFNVLPFDQPALEAFSNLPSGARQHHPQDCRIAAIALARGLVVVTRNTRHFEKIPGIRFEDWHK